MLFIKIERSSYVIFLLLIIKVMLTRYICNIHLLLNHKKLKKLDLGKY
jgi:hypothetical protein